VGEDGGAEDERQVEPQIRGVGGAEVRLRVVRAPIGAGSARPPEEQNKESCCPLILGGVPSASAHGHLQDNSFFYKGDDDGYLRLRVVRAPIGAGSAWPPTRPRGNL